MIEIVPSVKNPRLGDIDGINKIVNEEEDKRVNSDHLLPSKRDQKKGQWGDGLQ